MKMRLVAGRIALWACRLPYTQTVDVDDVALTADISNTQLYVKLTADTLCQVHYAQGAPRA